MKLNPLRHGLLTSMFGLSLMTFAAPTFAQEVGESPKRLADTPRVAADRKQAAPSDKAMKSRRAERDKERVKIRATVDVIDPSSSVNDIFSQLRKRDAKTLKARRLQQGDRLDRTDKAIERIGTRETERKGRTSGSGEWKKPGSKAGKSGASADLDKSGKHGKAARLGTVKQTKAFGKAGQVGRADRFEKSQKSETWGGFDKSGSFERGSKSGKSDKGAYDRGTKRDDRQQHPRSRGKKLMDGFRKGMMPNEASKAKRDE
ncbi:MAG: hypothetical protein VX589_11845 [Myxococcota bacterium]|nr:hypothetical protein [Myxococcota bacterium]